MPTRLLFVLVASLVLIIFTQAAYGQAAPPSGILGWWAGDGDARDISGNGFNGTLINSAYGVCGVGQCFDLRASGSIPHIQIADNALLKPPQFTVEVWIKFTPSFDNYAVAVAKGYASGDRDSYALGTSPQVANPQFFTTHNGASHQLNAPNNLANPNSWNHLAASYDGLTKRLYVNGFLVSTAFVGQPISYDASPAPLTIGADWENGNPAYRFNGSVDEATLYDHALTDTEIMAIYNAGVRGKIKSAPTAAGANSQTVVNDATIMFTSVSAGGITIDNSADAATLPALPAGNTHTGLAYDISTSAAYQQGAADDVRVCFNVPALSSANFASYRVLHLEAGNWASRTDLASVYPTLCTDNLTSLSPFAIVVAAPTAAGVSVGGRVFSAEGYPIARAVVSCAGDNGEPRAAVTNAFGYYRFDDVIAGQSYVFTVNHKRYSFTPQIVSVGDELTELNFTAATSGMKSR